MRAGRPAGSMHEEIGERAKIIQIYWPAAGYVSHLALHTA